MNGAAEAVDVVIVGSGAGGAPLAARLAEAGVSVVVLEAGRAFRPDDHVADELAADIYWMDERLSGGSDPTAFGANNSGMGVGGSTLHWGAFCPRPDARDLRLRSDSGQGEDWPIAHDELIGHVEAVERFVGVSGPADYPGTPAGATPFRRCCAMRRPTPWRAAAPRSASPRPTRRRRWCRATAPSRTGASDTRASTAAPATRVAAPAPRRRPTRAGCRSRRRTARRFVPSAA
ncbi:FAD-binding protein [Sphingomonas metalli]|uniref:FAD-binding protein n=1 Tax=Sphingomonas metalli TaxID=1779358 RepID=UPI0035714BC6